MEHTKAWTTYKAKDIKALESLAQRYRAFLDAGKTERECVTEAVRLAEAKGFVNIDSVKKAKPGTRVYANCMGKALLLFVVGKKPIIEGMNILGAHIDSPRIDLKQNPLYEDGDMAYLDTHYYGGIKKYQWVTLPLAMHGVVAKSDGTVVNITIGEDESDPIVGISDLLIHLAREQMGGKASNFIDGEALNIIIGGKPVTNADDKEKEPVKAGILKILEEKYGIGEKDFISAEIEVVPAGKARDFGLDRSMIMAYGHDDRSCAYPSLEAILNVKGVPERTCLCLLSDKEEIGSVGATGMHARYFENTVAELMNLAGEYSELNLRRALSSCRMLSSDVSAGFDPNFASVFEKKNAAFLGRGICFNKYTGAGGKSGSNDANAEFIGWLRKVMDDAGVNFQTSELGKVDAGGGGTIAYICALYGMNVIDCGVPVLSMHAPWEIINKADLYEALKAYTAFLAS
ncbi:MAG: aminopeptidase [Abditibacteriota bacterium]|nr:aminopeptidase [Abditibacteriota bacterium]